MPKKLKVIYSAAIAATYFTQLRSRRQTVSPLESNNLAKSSNRLRTIYAATKIVMPVMSAALTEKILNPFGHVMPRI